MEDNDLILKRGDVYVMQAATFFCVVCRQVKRFPQDAGSLFAGLCNSCHRRDKFRNDIEGDCATVKHYTERSA